ncbi:hypothetical protein THRCLA_22138 [Thraustotheca clavata]|uniref:Transmembrane protein n=1 Tax=Thraustotheca clavata TaxID=74557 RepID=A0A1V9ZBU3_9STRA|nr:hypothetical protein THRCLA_22138 [Thraustotheca clavata]
MKYGCNLLLLSGFLPLPFVSLVYKDNGPFWLVRQTFVWTSIIALALLCFMKFNSPTLSLCTTLLTTICTLHPLYCGFVHFYFLLQEYLVKILRIYDSIREANFFGRVFWSIVLIFTLPFTQFMTAYRKYYESFTNKLQLFTYFIIWYRTQ